MADLLDAVLDDRVEGRSALARLPATPYLPYRYVRDPTSKAPLAGCFKTHPPAVCISFIAECLDEIKETAYDHNHQENEEDKGDLADKFR